MFDYKSPTCYSTDMRTLTSYEADRLKVHSRIFLGYSNTFYDEDNLQKLIDTAMVTVGDTTCETVLNLLEVMKVCVEQIEHSENSKDVQLYDYIRYFSKLPFERDSSYTEGNSFAFSTFMDAACSDNNSHLFPFYVDACIFLMSFRGTDTHLMNPQFLSQNSWHNIMFTALKETTYQSTHISDHVMTAVFSPYVTDLLDYTKVLPNGDNESVASLMQTVEKADLAVASGAFKYVMKHKSLPDNIFTTVFNPKDAKRFLKVLKHISRYVNRPKRHPYMNPENLKMMLKDARFDDVWLRAANQAIHGDMQIKNRSKQDHQLTFEDSFGDILLTKYIELVFEGDTRESYLNMPKEWALKALF